MKKSHLLRNHRAPPHVWYGKRGKTSISNAEADSNS